MRVPAGERSFYEQVQEAAVPAREALLQSLHALPPTDGPDQEAGPSSPRELLCRLPSWVQMGTSTATSQLNLHAACKREQVWQTLV